MGENSRFEFEERKFCTPLTNRQKAHPQNSAQFFFGKIKFILEGFLMGDQ